LNLSFPIAAKTGTTNDFRDNWTLGYTPDLVAGVWVGNADYTPMVNTTGLSGAAPIWSQFMTSAVPYISNGHPSWFARPAGIVEETICSLSGTLPSQWCKGGTRTEIFASDQLPLPAGQDLRRSVSLDTWTGLEASPDCSEFTAPSQIVMNVTDPWAQKWFDTKDGKNWLSANDFPSPPVYAPQRECTKNDPHPELDLSVNDGSTVTQNTLSISGTADATADFKSWKLEFGLTNNPSNWTTLAQGDQPVNNGVLFNWNLSNLSGNTVSLRLHVTGTNGYAEKTVHFPVQLPPSPPPPPTLTPLPSPTNTVLPSPSNTPVPTLPTATPTAFPSNTPAATNIPTDTGTP
jgi:hypothetical protein